MRSMKMFHFLRKNSETSTFIRMFHNYKKKYIKSINFL